MRIVFKIKKQSKNNQSNFNSSKEAGRNPIGFFILLLIGKIDTNTLTMLSVELTY